MNTLNRSITSLAVLKVNWDERHSDYVDSFVPLFSHLLRLKKYKQVDIRPLMADFESEYGLSVPYHPMVTILRRLYSQGILFKADGGYFVNETKNQDNGFEAVSKDQERKLNKLTASFTDFCNDKYGEIIDMVAAEKALVDFFKESSLSFLYAAENPSVVPGVETKKSHEYLIAKFIQSANKSEPEIFQFILDIAVGSALANAISYGDVIEKNFTGRTRNLHLYLDADYIFILLGINGEEQRQAFVELTNDLLKDGAHLNIFDHTYDEVMTIFTNALGWMGHGDYEMSRASRALKYFVINDFKESDVEGFIARIPALLDTFKIKKIFEPDYNRDIEYQIDETKLREMILDAYGADPLLDPHVEETINRDIKSIYSICKLRKGKIAFTLHDAEHIFITTNTTLAKLSSRIQSNDTARFCVPPSITDVLIGTLLWLQNPAKVISLNEKKIMADAYAALQPDPYLIRKYFDQLVILKKEAKISEDEYFILRTYRVAFNLLSEKTKNDPEKFNPRTATEILNEINERHITDLKADVEHEKVLRKKTEEYLTSSQRGLIEREKEIKEKSIQYKNLLDFIVNSVTWVVFPLAIAIAIIALAINSFPEFFPNPIIKGIGFLVVLGIGLFGFNIKVFKNKLKIRIEDWIICHIAKNF